MKWEEWEVQAHDREEWRSRIKKAKARFGPQCHWWSIQESAYRFTDRINEGLKISEVYILKNR
jgi:hypothetical protein